MENVHTKPGLFHKIVSFAILGFLLILLSGPLMTLLTFACIGFVQIVIEAASAAVIGGLLGGVITSGPRFSEESIIVGGAIGAAVGALYGARMGRSARAASQQTQST